MTVGELIDKLKIYNTDTKISFFFPDQDGQWVGANFEEIERIDRSNVFMWVDEVDDELKNL